MDASPTNIIQYFDGSKQGVIPLFQRPYSWEAKSWGTLWDDVMAQYDPADRGSHFMGAIVTLPIRSVPVGVAKHMVIDGQQRLTTISILLAAIRSAAQAGVDLATAGIIGDLLKNRHYPDPDDQKLVPTQADRAAYKALVNEGNVEAFEESRIIQAYRFFQQKLGGKDPDDVAVNAAQTLQAVQQSLQVVMINLSETDDPYLIFESLNHKGKPLEQSDLVRNYVLMRFQHSTDAGGKQEVAYQDLWRPMEDELGTSMTEFLRHYGMRKGHNVRKGDIYTASKAEFEKLADAEQVTQRLIEMKSAASIYRQFLQPDKESADVIESSLRGIQELDSTVFYPLLLRLFQGSGDGSLSLEALAECLLTLESYFVRRLICGVPTNALNKVTLELCLNLPEQEPSAWLREKLSGFSGGRRWPADDEFTDALVNQQLYPRRRIAKYVLVALEDSFRHKEPVDSSNSTIEHLMPQTLTPEWISDLGEGGKDIHSRWLDTLGNLTLTGYNSELSNEPFSVKKQKLSHTHFELSRSVLECSQWGQTEIQARARGLAGRAVERWRR